MLATLTMPLRSASHGVPTLDLALVLVLLHPAWEVKLQEFVGHEEAACVTWNVSFHIDCIDFEDVLTNSPVSLIE